ncbi:MAG: DEAD/DEAH box helicase [Chitinispirillaceae bacterium]
MTLDSTLSDMDFFRNCFVLVPQKGSHRTILSVSSAKSAKTRIFCTCSKGSYATCSHARKLEGLYEELKSRTSPQLPYEHFLQSDFRKLFTPLMRRHPKAASGITARKERDRVILGMKNSQVHIEIKESGFCSRFLERAGITLKGVTSENRAALLSRTVDFVYTDHEKQLAKAGHRTVRMTEENSIWHAAAYHLYREADSGDTKISVGIENTLVLTLSSPAWEFKIHAPRDTTPDLLRIIKEISPDSLPFEIMEKECTLKFRVSYESDTVHITPAVCHSQNESTDPEVLGADNLFNTMAYLPTQNCFVPFDNSSLTLLAQGWGKSVTLKKENLSGFLEKNASVFSTAQGNMTVSPDHQYDLFSTQPSTQPQAHARGGFDRLINMPLFTEADRITMEVKGMDGQWCTLSLQFGSGDAYATLEELLAARRENKRYCITSEGFFDCESEGIVGLLPFQEIMSGENNCYCFPRSALMQYLVDNPRFTLTITGSEDLKNRLFSMRDSLGKKREKQKPLRGFTSRLRPYQENGLAWLLFLYDNGFGGLLCDDMGLGKTHQVLAFITALKEQRRNRNPVLVVCPVSVMGHWKRLCATFAPGLTCRIYHGTGRDIDDVTEDTDLFITSYGVLRADWDKLSEKQFEAAVFDEAQHLKNSQTAVSRAAESLCCNMKLGLSGTPVENSLADLKRLMDIVLPGYLGSDQSFALRFVEPIENDHDLKAREILRISVSPFILRRLKETVLSELPPKIEDNRICTLCDEQEVLYDKAIQSRGRSLIKQIRNSDKRIPYMHIFALLKKLKAICNHPALALETPEDYENHRSGKWELFTEIVEEALGSGQKVVVFSQYLDMIEIMRRYFEKNGIGHVILTGSSRNRERLISRFSDDPECRVFVGSLKAGGVGIDLVSASVVIHYDRWWNAAAEDQATDRVYRIGQTRGVQVVKLTTEDTLEEKIDRIISRKKELASLVVSEDSPDVVKSFSREEILELLDWNRNDFGGQVAQTGIEWG